MSNVDSGQTALMTASENGFTTVAELLIQAGADPNLANVDNETPLFLAAQVREYCMNPLSKWLVNVTKCTLLKVRGT